MIQRCNVEKVEKVDRQLHMISTLLKIVSSASSLVFLVLIRDIASLVQMHLRLPKLSEGKGVKRKFFSQSNTKAPETLPGVGSP